MDNRIEKAEGILHRWLPVVAGVCIGVFVLCFTLIDPYIGGKQLKVNPLSEKADRVRTVASAVAGVRATIDQVTQAVTTMDGNAETQRTVDEIVAQNDVIQRLWVVDTKGNIVYFGKDHPTAYNVERLAPQDIHLILDRLPASTLQTEQRIAILIGATTVPIARCP